MNHKNEVKTDNTILFYKSGEKAGQVAYTNLELVTPRENCNHGTRNQRIKMSETGKKKIKQSFTVLVKTGVEVITE